ncbi:hypothetical protein BM221_004076 [Beauveria bassiana]|uniref:Uncharacterized protein n=1 Tax=Beauveria bassiana TaxID=176275 RepID=A0A2N6NQ87_BEABA|nr:hypothetical protein BM221_004076 [Beauveria bassiana]
MSGFGFNDPQGFAGNQQQPNQPIQQAVGYIPMSFNNMNSGPVCHGQTMSNWPMDQAQPSMHPTSLMPAAYDSPFASCGQQMQTAAPRHTQSSTMYMGQANLMQSNAMFMRNTQSGMMNMEQMPTDNMQGAMNMRQAQSMQPNAMSMGHTQSGMMNMGQTQSMQSNDMFLGQTQSSMMNMGQTQSKQSNDMFMGQTQPGMMNMEQMPTDHMQAVMNMGQAQNPDPLQGVDFTAQLASMQNFSQQYPSMQHPGMQQTPSMQTPHKRATQKQSRSRKPIAQIMQGGRNSAGKRPPPRPVEVLDALLQEKQAEGKLLEGNRPELLKLSTETAELRKEREKSKLAEKMRICKERNEAALASRGQSQETVDHVESSATPKRQKRAAAAAAAAAADVEKSPETSSEETCHGSIFTTPVPAIQTSPSTPAGASGRKFIISQTRGAMCINPSALAITTTTAAEPIQQQSLVNEANDAAKEEHVPHMDLKADLLGNEHLSPMDLIDDLFGEAPAPLMDPNTDLLGVEHLSPMNSNAELCGDGPVPPMHQTDNLLGTEEYQPGQELSEMLEEAIERRQAEDATEDGETW